MEDGEFLILNSVLDNNVWNKKISNNLIANLIKDNSIVKYIFPKRWDAVQDSGDACLIQAFGKNILIDSHWSIFKNEIYNFLNRNNVTHIDYYINTHYHEDHAGNNVNLINDGYIDKNTKIYLPAYTRLIGNSGQMYNYYTATQQAMQQHNLRAESMTEGEVAFSLGYNFTATFYNCTTHIIDEEMQYTDYNNASTLTCFNHNGVLSLYTGDCSRIDRLITNNLLTKHLSFYKLPHHGLEAGTYTKDIDFLRITKPDYAYQTDGVRSSSYGNNLPTTEIKFLSEINSKLFAGDEQEQDAIFESNNKEFKSVQGLPLFRTGVKSSIIKYYVDTSYVNWDCNGTAEKPFKNLVSAISACNANITSEYEIYIKKYDTSGLRAQHYPHRFGRTNTRITIIGDGTEDIVIPETLFFQSGVKSYLGEYVFKNITFDASNVLLNSSSQITISYYSKVTFIDCKFLIDEQKEQINAYIWLGENGDITCKNCIFNKDVQTGISLHTESKATIVESTFDVEQYPIYCDGDSLGEIIEYGNICKRNYQDFVTIPSSNFGLYPYNKGIGPMRIWSGSLGLRNVSQTTTGSLLESWMLLIETGTVSNGTNKVDIIKGFGNNKIIAGTYNICTADPLLMLKFTIIDSTHFSIDYLDRRGIQNPTYDDYRLRGIYEIFETPSSRTYEID